MIFNRQTDIRDRSSCVDHRNASYTVKNGQKQRSEHPQILLQHIHCQNITNSSEVICNEHQPHIGACPSNPFLCENITEPPLSFYCSVRMFHNCLTSFIKMFFLKCVDSVSFIVIRILTSLNESAIF